MRCKYNTGERNLLEILFVILSGSAVVAALKLSKVVVPEIGEDGEAVVLKCPFDLERDQLYSVKWYKDGTEFYRYVPRYNPPKIQYPVNGVKVQLSESDSVKVTLEKLDLRSSGTYKCEVSAEGPSFASVQSEARMTVVHLPADGPQITGIVYEEYDVGDTLDLICTSSESAPPTKLSWYINDNQIDPIYVKTVSPPADLPLNTTNLTSSVSHLRLTLDSTHFDGGSSKVRCVASITALFWQDGDERRFVGPTRNSTYGFQLKTNLAPRVIEERDAYILLRGHGPRVMASLWTHGILTLLNVVYQFF